MALFVFRENDVITRPRPFFTCGAKNRCPPIGFKIVMGKLLHLPRTMAMFVFHETDVIALWAWSRGHTLNDANECSLPEQQGNLPHFLPHFEVDEVDTF